MKDQSDLPGSTTVYTVETGYLFTGCLVPLLLSDEQVSDIIFFHFERPNVSLRKYIDSM